MNKPRLWSEDELIDVLDRACMEFPRLPVSLVMASLTEAVRGVDTDSGHTALLARVRATLNATAAPERLAKKAQL
jgi:hypothetical protein